MFDFTGACFLVSSLTDYLTEKYGEADTKIILMDLKDSITGTYAKVPAVVDIIVTRYGAAAEKELHAGVIAHWCFDLYGSIKGVMKIKRLTKS